MRTIKQIDFMQSDESLVVDIVIPGEPQSKARARYAKKTGRFYTPHGTAGAEAAIGWQIKAAVTCIARAVR